MTQQTVEFMETEQHVVPIMQADQFEFREDKGFKWLQRLAIWVLRKLGCYALSEDIYYTKRVIKMDDLIDGLIRQQHEIVSHYNLAGGERVLIGSEEFSKLMCQPETKEMLSFDCAGSGLRSFRGMSITVIPWMKGILVVPASFT